MSEHPKRFVESSVDGRVGRIWLARPGASNGFHLGLLKALAGELRAMEARQQVSAVVISGKGEAFSAGGQVAKLKPWLALPEIERRALGYELMTVIRSIIFLIMGSPRTYIARVNGPAHAGGFILTMACDVRVASTTAEFMLPETRKGIVEPFSPVLLARSFQGPKARELCLLGSTLQVDEALKLGFLHSVAAPEALDDAVDTVLARILAGGPLSQATMKRLQRGHAPVFNIEAAVDSFVSAEALEGMAAGVEERIPAWAS